MNILRIYLLAGLVIHKAIWEVLKRRHHQNATQSHAAKSTKIMLIKAVKVSILIAIIVQTTVADVMPIVTDPNMIRVFGLAMYTLGLLVALFGRFQLGQNWMDIEGAAVLQHQKVVSGGLYRYVRHPIYIGDMMLLMGFELSLNSWLVGLVVLLAPIVLFQAIREERMLIQALPGYDEYCAHTKRFIPFVI